VLWIWWEPGIHLIHGWMRLSLRLTCQTKPEEKIVSSCPVITVVVSLFSLRLGAERSACFPPRSGQFGWLFSLLWCRAARLRAVTWGNRSSPDLRRSCLCPRAARWVWSPGGMGVWGSELVLWTIPPSRAMGKSRAILVSEYRNSMLAPTAMQAALVYKRASKAPAPPTVSLCFVF
jgi:hypothetical protein